MEFDFKVTEAEATQIINALAAQPFAQVYQLIGKLQGQFTTQQQPPLQPKEK